MSESGPGNSNEFLPHEWELVKELVFDCEPMDAAEQAAWLRVRAPSAKVRREVERLLQVSAKSRSFLQRPAAEQVLGVSSSRGETPLPAEGHLPDPAVADPIPPIGPFRIIRQLGRGGMGIVYEAIDSRLDRHVALKVLPPASHTDRDLRQRLLWDARAASRLNHPNVVTVYEVGSHGDVDYVAMECVRGSTLAEIIAQGPLPRAAALDYAVQAAAALDAAHAGGIIHRDLKPGNMMVTAEGIVKLVDFGLAKSFSGGFPAGEVPHTVQGSFAGTAAYVSPEMAEGRSVDLRSDIFSFGSVLYEMLTGRPAFSGNSAVSVLAGVIHSDPAPPSRILRDLDPRLDRIVERCLRKNPDERYQHMGEVRHQLEQIRDSSNPRLRRRVARSMIQVVGAAACLGALIFGGSLALRMANRRPEPVTLSKVTADTGLTAFPAISPDGKLLAYASDRGGAGNLDLWVQQVGGNDPIRLTSDPADDYQPAFSPDGTRIAYRSERNGGGVYITPALSPAERLLVPGCRDPKFSPDGAWIACWTGDVGGSFVPGGSHIQIVSSTGGQPRVFRPDFPAAAYPIWSPDSRRLLFLGRKTASTSLADVDWWSAAVEGTENVAAGAVSRIKSAGLSPPPGMFFVRPEAWLGRRNAVLFTATHGDATNIWELPLEASGKSAGPPARVTLGASSDASPAAAESPTLRSTVFASLTIDLGIWKLALSSPEAPPERLVEGYTEVASPQVTADGRTLVFSSNQAGGQRILAVDLATRTQHIVTTVPNSKIVHPVISPNGQWTAFVNGPVGYLTRTSDGIPEQVCPRCGPPTDVSGDGSQILFESATNEEKLQLWSREGLRPLLAGEDSKKRAQFAGRFSPDGKWVAFHASTRNSPIRQLFIVPNQPERTFSESEWIALSGEAARDRQPCWAPDAKRIYFLSDRDGFRCIWAIPVHPRTARPTGAAFAVAHFHHPRRTIRTLRAASGEIGLSAASAFLVFTMAELTGNIWLQTGPSDQ